MIVVLGLCAGCPGASQSVVERPKDGTQRVEVGGRQLTIDCQGAGGPTLVLDAAHGESSASVAESAAALRKKHRVCVYDRAGLGESEIDPIGPRSVQLLVYDLRQALRQAGERNPIILVARGVSGYAARLYAAQYPRELAGLVLVAPIDLGMEPVLLALLGTSASDAWLAAAAKREPLDYSRSQELMKSAFLSEVRVATVHRELTLAPLTDAGLSPAQAKDLRARAHELERELDELLGAQTYPDAEAAIVALLAAPRAAVDANSADAK